MRAETYSAKNVEDLHIIPARTDIYTDGVQPILRYISPSLSNSRLKLLSEMLLSPKSDDMMYPYVECGIELYIYQKKSRKKG